MSKILFCKRCGMKLNPPGTACPRCLLALAMEPEPAQPDSIVNDGAAAVSANVAPVPSGVDAPTIASPPPARVGDLELPTASELAPYFPQLEILELLGRGGMGAVYKARQRGLDRLVAVKILPPSSGQAPGFAERFTREARALARLSHPGIVAVYDFGHAQGLYYFIMEYVDGSDLRRLIRSGAVTPKEALAIVPQICDALQYAHDEGVIHRDIKPENILLDRKGQVKIADFGLAKLFGLATPDYTLTAAECSMGTPRYMAPEQMDNPKSVDHRADIYSLGVVFYEMLTGEVPAGRFAVPSQKSKSDARLDPVVLRSLEKEPDLRYQKVSDVKTAVATACSTPPPPPAMPPALPLVPPQGRSLAKRRRFWKRFAVVWVALVIVLLAIIIIANLRSDTAAHWSNAYPPGADGSTPLIRAVEQGNSQEVQRLLYSGADADARDAAGDTALTKAASLGLLGPAEEILKRVPQPDGRSAAGATPLALAAANGHKDLLELFVQHGAQVNARGNAKGQTALLLAAANGHLSAVEYLLGPDYKDQISRADPNLRDDDDLTPLVYAEAHGWPQVATLLRERGAMEDPNCGLTEAYMSALDGKPADAIPQIEKLLGLNIQEFQRPWHILAKEWIYTVPRPQIFLSLVLAECYERSGQSTKAQAILANSYGMFGTDAVVLYRREGHSDQQTGVRDSFSIDPAALQKWQTNPSTEPRVQQTTETTTPNSRSNMGSWVPGIVH